MCIDIHIYIFFFNICIFPFIILFLLLYFSSPLNIQIISFSFSAILQLKPSHSICFFSFHFIFLTLLFLSHSHFSLLTTSSISYHKSFETFWFILFLSLPFVLLYLLWKSQLVLSFTLFLYLSNFIALCCYICFPLSIQEWRLIRVF